MYISKCFSYANPFWSEIYQINPYTTQPGKNTHTPNELLPSTFPLLKNKKTETEQCAWSARHPKQHRVPELWDIRNNMARQASQVTEMPWSEVNQIQLTNLQVNRGGWDGGDDGGLGTTSQAVL